MGSGEDALLTYQPRNLQMIVSVKSKNQTTKQSTRLTGDQLTELISAIMRPHLDKVLSRLNLFNTRRALLVGDFSRNDVESIRKLGFDSVNHVSDHVLPQDRYYDLILTRQYLFGPQYSTKKVREIKKLLAPGGTLAIHEYDLSQTHGSPEQGLFERFSSIYRHVAASGHVDMISRTRLTSYIDPGTDFTTEIRFILPQVVAQPNRSFSSLAFETIGHEAIKLNIIQTKEYVSILERLRQCEATPHHIICFPGYHEVIITKKILS